MKMKTVMLAAAVMLVLSACAVKSAAPSSMDLREVGGAPMPPVMESASPQTGSTDYYAAQDNSAGNIALERLVIMNVDLSVVIPDPRLKMDEISSLATSLGGFIVSMNMYQVTTNSGETAPQGSISIRVPSDKLETALTRIKADAVDVPSENRSGQDVTSQYVDLQSQLTNLERAEQDLLAIMDQAQNAPGNDFTTRTQDVLNVYNQIVSIRSQIEQIKGQMKYYEDSSTYSLISVSLIAEETIQPIQIGTWKPEGVARDAIQALVNFLQGFVNFIIWLFLLVVPVLIVILGPLALIVWGIVSLVRRNKNKKQSGK
jgi:hypothetical protein